MRSSSRRYLEDAKKDVQNFDLGEWWKDEQFIRRRLTVSTWWQASRKNSEAKKQ